MLPGQSRRRAYGDAIVSYVRAKGLVRAKDIPAAIMAIPNGRDPAGGNRRDFALLGTLAREGRIFTRGIGGETLVASEASMLPPADDDARHLPMLEVGVGERRDCIHYDDCLDRFCKARVSRTRLRRQLNLMTAEIPRIEGPEHEVELPARCPVGCTHFEPIPKSFELGRAMIYFDNER